MRQLWAVRSASTLPQRHSQLRESGVHRVPAHRAFEALGSERSRGVALNTIHCGPWIRPDPKGRSGCQVEIGALGDGECLLAVQTLHGWRRPAHGPEPCAQKHPRDNGLTTNAREPGETEGSPGADGRSKPAGQRWFTAIIGYPRNWPVDSSGPSDRKPGRGGSSRHPHAARCQAPLPPRNGTGPAATPVTGGARSPRAGGPCGRWLQDAACASIAARRR
jgi:hypothetical protein